MSFLRTYRHWTAILLLTVYGFIATPVQLWHHHPQVAQKAKQGKVSGKGYSFVVKNNTVSDDCPICSHKYSTYIDYEYCPEISSVIFYADVKPDFCPSIIFLPAFHFSNKSPPVKA